MSATTPRLDGCPDMRLSELRRLLRRVQAAIAAEEYRTGLTRKAKGCGTESGYHAHRYLKEPTCALCRRAHAAHERARKAARKEAS